MTLTVERGLPVLEDSLKYLMEDLLKDLTREPTGGLNLPVGPSISSLVVNLQQFS